MWKLIDKLSEISQSWNILYLFLDIFDGNLSLWSVHSWPKKISETYVWKYKNLESSEFEWVGGMSLWVSKLWWRKLTMTNVMWRIVGSNWVKPIIASLTSRYLHTGSESGDTLNQSVLSCNKGRLDWSLSLSYSVHVLKRVSTNISSTGPLSQAAS